MKGGVGILKAYAAGAAPPAGDTVANSAAEVAFATNCPLPAGFINAVGRRLRLRARGLHGTAATAPTLTVRVKLGATVICLTGAMPMAASMTAKAWEVEAELQVTAVGSGTTGKVEAQGMAYFTGGNVTTSPPLSGMGNAAPVSVDTTVAHSLQVSVQMSTANAANTVALRMLSVEVLG